MSSSGRHFINDVFHLYFYMLPLTPPERIRALAFDENGDIRMDSPHSHDLSPPRDSEDEEEMDPADLLCPSPPENPDEIDPLDRDTPSLLDSGSENSWRDCTLVSPRSLYQELVGIPTVSQGVPNDVPVRSPKTSSSLPGPHMQSGPSPGPMSPPDWSTLLQTPSPPCSDCDVDLPSTGNSRGPIIPTSTLPVKDNSFHANAISVVLTSPTKAFPWAAIPPDLQHYFTIPYGKSVIDLAGVEFQPHTICAHLCCQPRLVVSDNILDGEAAIAIIWNLPLPGASGIEQTLQ